MAGSRLVDASKIVKAARGIALHHVSLRSLQIVNYQETSSLWASVRSFARPFLRVRDSSSTSTSTAWKSSFSSKANTSVTSTHNLVVPGIEHLVKSNGQNKRQKEILQDHFYEKSSANSTADSPPKSSVSVIQEKANEDPLPDGSIPGLSGWNPDSVEKSGSQPSSSFSKQPSLEETVRANDARKAHRQAETQIPSHEAKLSRSVSTTDDASVSSSSELGPEQERDVHYAPSSHAKPNLSSLPRVKLPKISLNVQETDERVTSKAINQDVFHSSKPTDHDFTILNSQTLLDRNEPDEDTYSKLFHSPKVARMLQKKHHLDTSKDDIALQHLKGAATEQRKPAATVDNENSTARDRNLSTIGNEATKRSSEENAAKLGTDIANGTTPTSGGLNNLKDNELTHRVNKGAYKMQESRVPSSRFGRLWQYGGLATSMAFGAVSEGLSRVTGSTASGQGSLILSGQNMERLVAKLSRMRGAALKLGQMMSFQDSKMLPAQIHEVLQRVQDSADYMPASQRDHVLSSNLGRNWSDLFSHFDEMPLAAASIGQVHGAVLKENAMRVAVKIQYPGVSNSIDSDLNNLSILLTASRLLPKGLYLDKTIDNARVELAWECDYEREAKAAKKFKDLLSDEPSVFHVPEIIDSASTSQVLTMERMEGIGVTKVRDFTQQQKDWIGTQILRLCLREITEFRYMQTDPNWTNFLYNSQTKKLELLDFGASRDFPQRFIDSYIRILQAAAQDDREACRDISIDLGYLTGHESKAMLDAHVSSILTLAEPFRETSPEVYDFRDQTITDRVRRLIPFMIRERLAPPPEETYSLHRKLSGAFLLCARLGSRVRCRELFKAAIEKVTIRPVV